MLWKVTTLSWELKVEPEISHSNDWQSHPLSWGNTGLTPFWPSCIKGIDCMLPGLGILLIVVVIIGWRCMPAGEEPCHRLFDQCLNGNARRTNQQESARRLDHDQWFGGELPVILYSCTFSPVYCYSLPGIISVLIHTPVPHLHIELDLSDVLWAVLVKHNSDSPCVLLYLLYSF